jgi:4-hydroxy-tetrahydrodipicolinate synthase
VRRALAAALEAANGRVPVYYMGVEPRHAGELLEQARLAKECGVDGFHVYSLDMGHGQAPRLSEIEWHFRGLLEAIEIPCIVSSHYWEGYVLDTELMLSLACDYAHLKGFLVTSQDTLYTAAVLEALPAHVSVHVGGPMQALEAFAMGASGYLSTLSNFAPRLCQRVIDTYARGDYAAAHSAWWRLLRLKRRIYASGENPAPLVKAALEALGRPGTGLRSPHQPASATARQAIEDALEEFREDL